MSENIATETSDAAAGRAMSGLLAANYRTNVSEQRTIARTFQNTMIAIFVSTFARRTRQPEETSPMTEPLSVQSMVSMLRRSEPVTTSIISMSSC